MITQEQKDRYKATVRERYANDPEFREKRRAKTRKAMRKRRANPAKIDGDRERARINQRRYREKLAKGHEPLLRSRYRTINGVLRRVYSCAEIVRELKTYRAHVDNMIARGTIPEPQFQNPRLFTMQQFALIRRWIEIPRYDFARKRKIKKLIAECWQIN